MPLYPPPPVSQRGSGMRSPMHSRRSTLPSTDTICESAPHSAAGAEASASSGNNIASPVASASADEVQSPVLSPPRFSAMLREISLLNAGYARRHSSAPDVAAVRIVPLIPLENRWTHRCEVTIGQPYFMRIQLPQQEGQRRNQHSPKRSTSPQQQRLQQRALQHVALSMWFRASAGEIEVFVSPAKDASATSELSVPTAATTAAAGAAGSSQPGAAASVCRPTRSDHTWSLERGHRELHLSRHSDPPLQPAVSTYFIGLVVRLPQSGAHHHTATGGTGSQDHEETNLPLASPKHRAAVAVAAATNSHLKDPTSVQVALKIVLTREGDRQADSGSNTPRRVFYFSETSHGAGATDDLTFSSVRGPMSDGGSELVDAEEEEVQADRRQRSNLLSSAHSTSSSTPLAHDHLLSSAAQSRPHSIQAKLARKVRALRRNERLMEEFQHKVHSIVADRIAQDTITAAAATAVSHAVSPPRGSTLKQRNYFSPTRQPRKGRTDTHSEGRQTMQSDSPAAAQQPETGANGIAGEKQNEGAKQCAQPAAFEALPSNPSSSLMLRPSSLSSVRRLSPSPSSAGSSSAASPHSAQDEMRTVGSRERSSSSSRARTDSPNKSERTSSSLSQSKRNLLLSTTGDSLAAPLPHSRRPSGSVDAAAASQFSLPFARPGGPLQLSVPDHSRSRSRSRSPSFSLTAAGGLGGIASPSVTALSQSSASSSTASLEHAQERLPTVPSSKKQKTRGGGKKSHKGSTSVVPGSSFSSPHAPPPTATSSRPATSTASAAATPFSVLLPPVVSDLVSAVTGSSSGGAVTIALEPFSQFFHNAAAVSAEPETPDSSTATSKASPPAKGTAARSRSRRLALKRPSPAAATAKAAMTASQLDPPHSLLSSEAASVARALEKTQEERIQTALGLDVSLEAVLAGREGKEKTTAAQKRAAAAMNAIKAASTPTSSPSSRPQTGGVTSSLHSTPSRPRSSPHRGDGIVLLSPRSRPFSRGNTPQTPHAALFADSRSPINALDRSRTDTSSSASIPVSAEDALATLRSEALVEAEALKEVDELLAASLQKNQTRFISARHHARKNTHSRTLSMQQQAALDVRNARDELEAAAASPSEATSSLLKQRTVTEGDNSEEHSTESEDEDGRSSGSTSDSTQAARSERPAHVPALELSSVPTSAERVISAAHATPMKHAATERLADGCSAESVPSPLLAVRSRTLRTLKSASPGAAAELHLFRRALNSSLRSRQQTAPATARPAHAITPTAAITAASPATIGYNACYRSKPNPAKFVAGAFIVRGAGAGSGAVASAGSAEAEERMVRSALASAAIAAGAVALPAPRTGQRTHLYGYLARQRLLEGEAAGRGEHRLAFSVQRKSARIGSADLLMQVRQSRLSTEDRLAEANAPHVHVASDARGVAPSHRRIASPPRQPRNRSPRERALLLRRQQQCKQKKLPSPRREQPHDDSAAGQPNDPDQGSDSHCSSADGSGEDDSSSDPEEAAVEDGVDSIISKHSESAAAPDVLVSLPAPVPVVAQHHQQQQQQQQQSAPSLARAFLDSLPSRGNPGTGTSADLPSTAPPTATVLAPPSQLLYPASQFPSEPDASAAQDESDALATQQWTPPVAADDGGASAAPFDILSSLKHSSWWNARFPLLRSSSGLPAAPLTLLALLLDWAQTMLPRLEIAVERMETALLSSLLNLPLPDDLLKPATTAARESIRSGSSQRSVTAIAAGAISAVVLPPELETNAQSLAAQWFSSQNALRAARLGGVEFLHTSHTGAAAAAEIAETKRLLSTVSTLPVSHPLRSTSMWADSKRGIARTVWTGLDRNFYATVVCASRRRSQQLAWEISQIKQRMHQEHRRNATQTKGDATASKVGATDTADAVQAPLLLPSESAAQARAAALELQNHGDPPVAPSVSWGLRALTPNFAEVPRANGSSRREMWERIVVTPRKEKRAISDSTRPSTTSAGFRRNTAGADESETKTEEDIAGDAPATPHRHLRFVSSPTSSPRGGGDNLYSGGPFMTARERRAMLSPEWRRLMPPPDRNELNEVRMALSLREQAELRGEMFTPVCANVMATPIRSSGGPNGSTVESNSTTRMHNNALAAENSSPMQPPAEQPNEGDAAVAEARLSRQIELSKLSLSYARMLSTDRIARVRAAEAVIRDEAADGSGLGVGTGGSKALRRGGAGSVNGIAFGDQLATLINPLSGSAGAGGVHARADHTHGPTVRLLLDGSFPVGGATEVGGARVSARQLGLGATGGGGVSGKDDLMQMYFVRVPVRSEQLGTRGPAGGEPDTGLSIAMAGKRKSGAVNAPQALTTPLTIYQRDLLRSRLREQRLTQQLEESRRRVAANKMGGSAGRSVVSAAAIATDPLDGIAEVAAKFNAESAEEEVEEIDETTEAAKGNFIATASESAHLADSADRRSSQPKKQHQSSLPLSLLSPALRSAEFTSAVARAAPASLTVDVAGAPIQLGEFKYLTLHALGIE